MRTFCPLIRRFIKIASGMDMKVVDHFRKDKLRQFGNCKNVVEYIKIIEPECRRARFLTSDYVT